MDSAFHEALASGIEALGLPVDEAARALLERYADRLLAWNRKVNLTAITAPAELAEKHLVDSLVLLPFLTGAGTLLDVGSGAGLPGIPLACARRDLSVTCCDGVAKKIAFVKAVSAELDLPVRGVAVRAEGEPEREGLPRADAVVSRALAEPDRWVPVGARYLAEGGTLFAMLGREVDRAGLEAAGAAEGLTLVGLDVYELPVSHAARAVARWQQR
ncbi:methyltransferase GidB [Anaeromyxobacter dehalogenans 2CP-1]|uniref:Ribosomal RNA small subunit methyltransferase G n=1 Tax=Anaeromyxobacter dehalogenans (strain ATCC BAA-258 / DSM 21875 / 2CP-1) TaxID=455488 RepID=RSMG_ANAD2|nr:16S rRNA (guanine(527)-N(7))-methyltransferase RsmG [Anaeromyxobacter dehalogenans]B8JDK2.1 RecName: Full=Ribosomal RNA small subunit methyltransferase G; AltName: Full=16S rRNA 7-methylguanosine methyltransferase; Short=16S rRNA m7G methyltransferase [Anaeromyxobacter dehalogenans 2CP-1]ACL67828.1 methyltransferase GidB [Anaeromyxobacter dehalogenans 2CP-1]